MSLGSYEIIDASSFDQSVRFSHILTRVKNAAVVVQAQAQHYMETGEKSHTPCTIMVLIIPDELTDIQIDTLEEVGAVVRYK